MGEGEFHLGLLSLKCGQQAGRYRRSKLRSTLRDSSGKIPGLCVLVKTMKADDIKGKV